MAKELSRHLKATYLRIDSIEQAIKDSLLHVDEVIDAGYLVGYALARENLLLGRTVVADSVNPIEITRKAWVEVAKSASCDYVEVEVICSDEGEHKNRIETRKADIAGHVLPNWQEVKNRDYEAWASKQITIDTAGKSLEDSINELFDKLQLFLSKRFIRT